MAWSTEISQLITETEQFIDTVELKKPVLDAAANTAVQNAAAASLAAADTAVIAASLAPSADTSRGHAVATEAIANLTRMQQDAVSDSERQASLAAGYALNAGSIVQQDLSGVTATALHRSPAAVTSLFVYDTSKDSDGGAWTEKCQNTSWYNEPLSGKWLGQCLTELAARTYGAVLGPNLVTNGTFDSGTTGWAATSTTLQVTNSMLSVPSVTATSSEAYQLITVVPGKLYEGRIDLISGIGRPRISDGGINNTHLTPNVAYGPQSFRFAFIPTTTTIAVRLLTELANSVTVWDNISINEVTSLTTTSNDYFQLNTDGKIYRLWKNMFSRSAEFDTAWIKQRVSVDSNATTAPDGTLTADKIISTTVTGEKTIGQTPPAGGKLFSVYAKAGEISSLQLFGFVNGASRGATFNLSDGSYTTIGGVVATITPVGSDGWYRCEALYSPGWAGEISYRLPSGTGNNVDGLFLWGAQLEISDVATIYEAKGIEGSISEVFRGNKQDFPKLAGIVSESANVTIYDLTEPGRPMWMRFTNGTNTFLGFIVTAAVTTAVAALAGRITIGTSAHCHILDFSNDDTTIAYGGGSVVYEHINRRISSRQANGGFRATTAGFGYIISNANVNAIAMTILPDAPTDPITGLKIPTIALGTNGGMSVIQDEGVVRNGSGLNNVVSIAITPSAVYAGRTDGTLYYANNPGTLGNAFGFLSRAVTAAPGFAFGGVGNSKVVTSPRAGLFRLTSSYSRVQMIYRNTIDIARSIVTTITNTFNTGWTAGDVRRVYLSDTILLPATETELVAYPDMSAVNVGWSENRGGTLVYDANGLLVTNTSPFQGGLMIPLTLYNGDALRITMDIEASGTGGIYGGQVVSGFVFYNTVVGRTQVTIDTILTAPNPTVIFFIMNPGQTLRVRYLSIKRLSPDRSYKLGRASIVGTLPRTQVASGASLVGYSGWSADNYIREPYSTDLDFGTGEFSASAWTNIPVTLPITNFSPVGSEITVSGWTNNGMNTFTTTGGSFTGAKTVYGGNAYALSSNTIPVTLNKIYRVTLNVSATTLDAYSVSFTSVANSRSTTATFTGTGTKVGLIRANTSTGNFTLAVFNSVLGSITVDSVTVQEVDMATIFDRNYSTGPHFRLGVNGFGNITATAFDGTTTRAVTTTAAYNTGQWLKAEANYTTDGTLGISVNGREVAVTRGTPLLPLSSRYNLLTWSEDLSNTTFWARTTSTITGAQPDRDGGNTAFVFEATNATNPFIRQAISVNVPGAYTFTIYAKYFNAKWIILYFNGVTATAWFDVQDGVIGGFTGVDYISHNMTSAGNGYWRLSLTVNVVAPITLYPTLRPVNIDASSGTTIGLKVYLEDGQLELGSIAKTYQRVTTVAETDVAPLTIGNSFALDAPFPGSIAMLKIGATVPTAEQSTFMYEQEKQMFRADVASVLPDGNNLIDMSYDDATDRWSTISSTNESYWTGLVRNAITPVPAGSIYSKITTTSGIELAARAGSPATIANPGVDLSIPTYLLREDLNKRAEAASKAFKEIVNFDYVGGFTASTTSGSTAITSVANLTYPVSPVGATISGTGIPANTTIVAVVGTTMYISAAATATATGVSISFLDFELPVGFEAETVATAGAIRREGATSDFTRLFDGFIESIRFAVAPGTTTWVQIQASRIIS